ncbi:hypothetical protein AALP_AAs46323U000100, partial [Arabis alpina]
MASSPSIVLPYASELSGKENDGLGLLRMGYSEDLWKKHAPIGDYESRALADPNTDVHGRMINACIMIIDKHGKENVSLLFPIFESYLNKRYKMKKNLTWFVRVLLYSVA